MQGMASLNRPRFSTEANIKRILKWKSWGRFMTPPPQLVNPFKVEESVERSSSGTPKFKKDSNQTIFSIQKMGNIEVRVSKDYDDPTRYLHDLFHDKRFQAFKKSFWAYAKKSNICMPPKTDYCSLKNYSTERKNLYLDLVNTLLFISKRRKNGLPELCKINPIKAEELECDPCFVYLRPFTRIFLNSLSKKVKILYFRY